MPAYITVILLLLFLSLWIKRMFKVSLKKQEEKLFETRALLSQLNQEEKVLSQESALVHSLLEKTVAMFEVAKIISKSLDEEKVFDDFRQEMGKHLSCKECAFFKPDIDPQKYSDWLLAPLSLDNEPIGYLAAQGVDDDDRDTFFILSHQFILGIKRAVLYRKVTELSIVDAATGSFTRRYYLERLSNELERSRNFQYNFSLLMVDIDHFKECNDHFGHLVGDAILKEVASVIKENIRQVDSLGRYGGEEFLVTLIETDKQGARFAAERIRQAMESRSIKAYDENLKVTMSIGISTYPEDSKEMAPLIDKADKALYRAKHAGRNRVCISGVNR